MKEETQPKEVKPTYYDKVELTTPTTPSWTKRNHLVIDTEEYQQFIEAVKQQGGQVTDAFAARGGVGLSVQYMLPAGRRI